MRIEELPGLDRLGSGVSIEDSEQKGEVRFARGYNLRYGEIQGVFTLTEFIINNSDGQIKRYILTHDTLRAPLVRGVILEDGQVVKYDGFDRGCPSEEEVVALFKAFDNCEKHRLPVTQGTH